MKDDAPPALSGEEAEDKKKPASKLEYIVDLSGDGKVTAADLVAWMLMVVFFGLFAASMNEFLKHLYARAVGASTENLILYTGPLAQVLGTLVTVVYSVAFLYSSVTADTSVAKKKRFQKINNFLDINKDGNVGILDWVCCVTGVMHVAVLFVDVGLFMNGYMKTSDIVDLIAANTRLIILFLSSSYAAHERDPGKKSGWRFLFDINHDGSFQLVDTLAMICMVLYLVSVVYAYADLVFLPIASSDVWSLISLTGQLNFILISSFAIVYLSKSNMSVTRERLLGLFSVFYVILLLRTVREIYTIESSRTFEAISALANGMVLGVTQLVMGSFMVHNQINKSM